MHNKESLSSFKIAWGGSGSLNWAMKLMRGVLTASQRLPQASAVLGKAA